MNTYLLPYICDEKVQLEHVVARNRKDAAEKFINKLSTMFDIDEYFVDWDEFVREMKEYFIIIGSIYDINEF